jgi:hypothetical protein
VKFLTLLLLAVSPLCFATETPLDEKINARCEFLKAPKQACIDIYNAAIRHQMTFSDIDRDIPHFEDPILEDIRNALVAQDKLGLSIEKELFKTTAVAQPVSGDTLDTDYIDKLTLKRSGGGSMEAAITRSGKGFRAEVSTHRGNLTVRRIPITDPLLVSKLDLLFTDQMDVGSKANFCIECMSGTWLSVEILPGRQAVQGQTYGMTDAAKIEAVKQSNQFTIRAPTTSLNSSEPNFFSELEAYLSKTP